MNPALTSMEDLEVMVRYPVAHWLRQMLAQGLKEGLGPRMAKNLRAERSESEIGGERLS